MKTAKQQIIEQYQITDIELEKVVNTFVQDGYISMLPAREKKKAMILLYLIDFFEENRDYTEQEVNEIIAVRTSDYAMVRRYLIDYGLLMRTRDCKKYWKNS